MTVRFSNQLVAELYQPFWAAWQAQPRGPSRQSDDACCLCGGSGSRLAPPRTSEPMSTSSGCFADWPFANPLIETWELRQLWRPTPPHPARSQTQINEAASGPVPRFRPWL